MLGLGRDAHVAFNEPGSGPGDGVRRVASRRARVSVVTSVWHLRAPYFFAPYRAFGLELRLVPARPLRGSAHLLAEELGGLAGMARQRRAATDAVRLPEGS